MRVKTRPDDLISFRQNVGSPAARLLGPRRVTAATTSVDKSCTGSKSSCARHGRARRESSKVGSAEGVVWVYDLSYRAGGGSSGSISRRRRAVTAENWIARSTTPRLTSPFRGCRARLCEEPGPLDADRVTRRDGAEVVESAETAASDAAEPLEEEQETIRQPQEQPAGHDTGHVVAERFAEQPGRRPGGWYGVSPPAADALAADGRGAERAGQRATPVHRDVGPERMRLLADADDVRHAAGLAAGDV